MGGFEGQEKELVYPNLRMVGKRQWEGSNELVCQL